MNRTEAPLRSGVWVAWNRRAFQVSWGILSIGGLALIATLQPVWASKPELADRFLVPLTSAWLIYRAVPRLKSMPVSPTYLGLPLVLFGSTAFALGWYLIVQVNTRPILLWWLITSLAASCVGVMMCQQGWTRARTLIFPLAFCLFSLPWPNRINWPLQAFLKEATTACAVHTLPLLGIPVERSANQGYVLSLPSGDLGVAEACSGVRSVTALFAIAALVAYLRSFGILRSVFLIILTFGVVVVSNSLRVIISGILQELFGTAAIEGTAHEFLGITVVLTGFGLIVWLSRMIKPKFIAQSPMKSNLYVETKKTVYGILSCIILILAAAVCLWSERYREEHRELINLEEIPLEFAGWKGDELTIPSAVKEMLICDQIIYRSYTNSFGQEVHIWVMFWANVGATAHMHHPDICYPWRGWTVNKAGARIIKYGNNEYENFTVSARHYTKPEQQQILLYWTQAGNCVLSDGYIPGELYSGHSWLFQMLQDGRKPIESGARLSFLVGTETRGDVESGEVLLTRFCNHFATMFYERHPWAKPANVTLD